MAKKIKRQKAKGSGRKKLYNEETDVVTFRAPVSKIEEIKQHVKGMLARWHRQLWRVNEIIAIELCLKKWRGLSVGTLKITKWKTI